MVPVMNNIIDLGRVPYETGYREQLLVHSRRSRDLVPDTLILLENNHVITAGKSASEKNLLVSREYLEKISVDFFKVERGGDYTYHGPGQLAGYPVLRLPGGLAGLREFVRKLETCLVIVLDEFGIRAEGSGETDKKKPVGVWVEGEKIAALGIAVKKGVTFHGFALNVNTELAMYDLIIPCGLNDKKVTSMEKVLGERVSMEDVKKSAAEAFNRVFRD